jgi:hypothetical protein
MYPRNEEVAAILGDVSTVISMTDEAEFAALVTLSSLLAPFYHLQHAAEMWARAQGVKQVVDACVICVNACVMGMEIWSKMQLCCYAAMRPGCQLLHTTHNTPHTTYIGPGARAGRGAQGQ